jgi:cell division protein FtsZ
MGSAIIKTSVIGIGGAGSHSISYLNNKLMNINMIAIDTDKTTLLLSKADTRLLIGEDITNGNGIGGKPEIGERAARNSEAIIREVIKDSDVVFIVAGLGGGTGSGAFNVVAQIAKELDILTIAIFTMPFSFEGRNKKKIAQQSIEKTYKIVDSYLPIENDKLFEIASKNSTYRDMFSQIDDIIVNLIKCITGMINTNEIINFDFLDFKSMLKESGRLFFGIGRSSKQEEPMMALEKALHNQLLDNSIENATKIILSIRGNKKISMVDFFTVKENLLINLKNKNAKIILGVSIEEDSDFIVSIISVNPIVTIITKEFLLPYEEINKKKYKYNVLQENFYKYIEQKNNRNIFISYSHDDYVTADQVHDIINKILKNKYSISRDVRNMEYKDSFKQFMETIPSHNYVLMLISKSYLTSENCMYEVLETMRNHDFKERMLFIILEGAKIYEPNAILQYQKFWNSTQKQKEMKIIEEVKEKNFYALGYLYEQWKKTEKIKLDISDFIRILKDEKGYKFENLINSNFKSIINYINNRDKKIGL